jgi:hypothetical protein
VSIWSSIGCDRIDIYFGITNFADHIVSLFCSVSLPAPPERRKAMPIAPPPPPSDSPYKDDPEQTDGDMYMEQQQIMQGKFYLFRYFLTHLWASSRL